MLIFCRIGTFDKIRAEKTLLNQFKTSTLLPFGLEGQDLQITAAGTILEYAVQTQGTELSHINHIVIEKEEKPSALTRPPEKELGNLSISSRRFQKYFVRRTRSL